jgi:solute carrier family 25 carnitine/acylcarnitine transporter 20/29
MISIAFFWSFSGGWLPPLWGSGLYRSTQFAVYEALYTKWDANRAYGPSVSPDPLRPNLNTVLPFTFGIESRVLEAAWCASLARAAIECPIEYAKVARQTGQGWALSKVYTGFGVQWLVERELCADGCCHVKNGR